MISLLGLSIWLLCRIDTELKWHGFNWVRTTLGVWLYPGSCISRMPTTNVDGNEPAMTCSACLICDWAHVFNHIKGTLGGPPKGGVRGTWESATTYIHTCTRKFLFFFKTLWIITKGTAVHIAPLMYRTAPLNGSCRNWRCQIGRRSKRRFLHLVGYEKKRWM